MSPTPMPGRPLPPLTDPCWMRLASGGLGQLRTRHLGLELLRLRMARSDEPLALKAAQVFQHFARWADELQDELAQIADDTANNTAADDADPPA